MLNAYITATQQLLSNPAAPTTLYSTSDITGYINEARLQLAGETECIRGFVTLSVTTITNIYPFASLTSLPTGVSAVYNLRQGQRVAGSGYVYMGSRPFPWAQLYWMNTSAPVAAAPTEWSQYKIGDSGSLILDNTPDASYVLQFDVSCEPAVLTTDSTVEAIPYPYRDAVPFFAAFFAYMSAQRQQDADTMYGRYQAFVDRARKTSVPNVLPNQYDQYTPPPQAKAVQSAQGGG